MIRLRRPRAFLAPVLEAILRRAFAAEEKRLRAGGAPAATGTPPTCKADGWKEPKDMTIIRRKAFEVRAGDVIVTDPDHPGRDVRWRAKAPAKRTASDRTLIDCTDLADGRDVLAVFVSLDEISVEPAGVR